MYVCMYVCSSMTLERLDQFQPNLVHMTIYYIYYIIYIEMDVCVFVGMYVPT
jgi:hypothetical protein